MPRPRPKPDSSPELPGLAETISMVKACKLLGIRQNAKALARLGIKPVQELKSGSLTFRNYSLSDIKAAMVKLAEEDTTDSPVSRAVTRAVNESGVHASSVERQILGVMCEMRDDMRAIHRLLVGDIAETAR